MSHIATLTRNDQPPATRAEEVDSGAAREQLENSKTRLEAELEIVEARSLRKNFHDMLIV
jgi:hypothetical protein